MRGLFLIHVLNNATILLRNTNVKTIDKAINKAFITKKKQYINLIELDKKRLKYKDKLNNEDIEYLTNELERSLKWIKEDKFNNLKNKKILNMAAKEIRKNIKCDFALSFKIAKKFLNHEEWKEENENLGFVFDWEWNGKFEDKHFQGKIENFDNGLEYEFTYEMYLLQNKYRSNQR